MTTKVLKIGIDFGGVLSIHDRVYEDKAVKDSEDKAANAGQDAGQDAGQHRSSAIDMPNALETLTALKNTKIDGIDRIEYYLISFAGKTRAKETKDSILALTSPDLFDGLYFTKSKQYKKFVCQYLGISVMIDDILDILTDISKSMKNKPHLILFTGDPSYHEHNEPLSEAMKDTGIIEVQTWPHVAELIKKIPWNIYDNMQADPTINLTKYIYQL